MVRTYHQGHNLRYYRLECTHTDLEGGHTVDSPVEKDSDNPAREGGSHEVPEERSHWEEGSRLPV